MSTTFTIKPLIENYSALLLILMLLAPIANAAHLTPAHAVSLKNQNLDKLDHIAVGVALGSFDWKLGCAAGLAKEMRDEVADKQDFVATCAGSTLAHMLGKGETGLYRYNVALILLDGISTDRAIRQGAKEIGLPKYLISSTPTTAQVAAFTALKLYVLNSTKSWDRDMRDAFQLGFAITNTFVVRANYSVNFK